MRLMAGPNTGLGTWPARRARISPDRTALSDPHRALTYAELAERTARYAGALRRLGVGRGDRVAYLGVNAVEVFETFFAAWLLGAIAVPLNYRLSGPEIRYMLADSGASVLVHSADADALVAAAGQDTVRHVLAVHPDSSPDALDYAAEIAAGPVLDEAPPVALDDPALILYTSGTTGRPKGAVLTHGSMTWNTVNFLAHVDVLSTDRALCIAPLFHCVGLGQVTLPTLFKGGSVEVLPKADPGLVLRGCRPERITSFSAVPTMLQMMCEHPSWDAADLSSLTLVQYGGSPVQERVARAWLARGVRLVQGYGMTEASPGVYMGTHDGTAAHPTSVGVPHFFTDVALLRDDRPGPAGGPTGRAGRPRAARVRRVLEPSGRDGGGLRRRQVVPHRRRPPRRRRRLGARGRPGQGHVHLGRGERLPRRGGGRRGPAGRGRPTAPSSGSPTPGGARSAPPTCSCAKGRRSPKPSCAPTWKPTSPATRCPSTWSSWPSCRTTPPARSAGWSCGTGRRTSIRSNERRGSRPEGTS